MSGEATYFGQWCLLPRTRILVTEGERIALGERATDILLALIEARGEVVSKEALVSRAWQGRFVEDSNLTVQIAALRKVLGPEGAEIVVTVPGRGYRFGGAVRPAPAPIQLVQRNRAADWAPREPLLAVLPFRTSGSDPQLTQLADAILEDLITALSHIRWFTVLARDWGSSLWTRDMPVPEIGRELSVSYLVTGSLRCAAGRVTANVALVDRETGVPAWSERFDHSFGDIVALQDRAGDSIVAALEPALRQAEIERLRRRPGERPPAWEAWLRATARMLRMTRDNCDGALALLGQALETDPDFAPAQAAAAWCRMWRVLQGFSDDLAVEVDDAICLAEAALAQGRDCPQVLAQVASVFGCLTHRVDVALPLAERAVSLHSSSALAHCTAGWTHLYIDNTEVAIRHLEQAVRLDPVDAAATNPLAGLAAAHLVAGHPDDALRWARRAAAVSPERTSPHRVYVAALGITGAPAEAAVRHLLALDPAFNLGDFSRLHHGRADTRFLAVLMEGLRRASVPERPPPARPALRVVQGG